MQLNCEEEINSLENEIKDNGKQYIDYTEVPILPCVANALHLSFIDDKTLYRVRFTEGGVWRGTQATIREMTRKEWIYSYIDYTRACLTLNHFWNV